MSQTQNVRIVMTDHGRGEVWVDGQKIPNVCAVRFVAEEGRPNAVQVEIVAKAIDIEGPASLTVMQVNP